jgi:chromosomal replication initiation ATPase DnaA
MTRRRARTAFARQVAMYLGHVVLGLTFTEIGESFGRHRTTAAHACRVVEDRRENPTIDAVLSRLERACACLSASCSFERAA